MFRSRHQQKVTIWLSQLGSDRKLLAVPLRCQYMLLARTKGVQVLYDALFSPHKWVAGQCIRRTTDGWPRFQRRGFLDVRWRNLGRMRPEDLALEGYRKALRLWADIKRGRAVPERDYPSEGGTAVPVEETRASAKGHDVGGSGRQVFAGPRQRLG